jgi:hypothetical protein
MNLAGRVLAVTRPEPLHAGHSCCQALQVLGPLADLAGRIRTAEGTAWRLLAWRAARHRRRSPVQGQGFGGREDGKAARRARIRVITQGRTSFCAKQNGKNTQKTR